MGQNRNNRNQVQIAGAPKGNWSAPIPASVYEKAPQAQAAGQTTPEVGEDIALRVLSNKGKLEQEEADPEMRMAADILDSDLIKSLALESTKTKYGPGQISKAPGEGSYLGEASYPAGRTV